MIAISSQWRNQHGMWHRATLFDGDSFFDAQVLGTQQMLKEIELGHFMYQNVEDFTLHMINEQGEYKYEHIQRQP